MTAHRRPAVTRVKSNPPAPRRLPLQGHMVPTDGDRDDSCQHYADCLTAHVRAYVSAPAMCPDPCPWYTQAPRLDPCDYADSGLGKMEVM